MAKREAWSSQLGAILAVAGSAVGLGNFLRFPGKAAQYGGGAFLIPYFVALLVLGIPIAWAEWTMGRYAGVRGFNSAPGIFSRIWRHPASKYFGVIALLIPIVIYMYYVYIEAWCLAYAWFYLTGKFPLPPEAGDARYSDFFNQFVGALADGSALSSGAIVFLAIVFFVNFFLVYRGLTGGIEKFVTIAMPVLLIVAVVLLVRVLTLGTPDADKPDQSVINGLGFMWNPRPTVEGGGTFSALADPQVWLEAAGQIFFSLSVGFGVIMNYASYLRRKDDVVLSSLSACATNELCEVGLGGLITLPAAFIFLGAAPLAAVVGSSLALGFHTFPMVFEHMPLGQMFGFLWFFLLFIAAITSSISMLQPAIAFLTEAFGVSRFRAALILTAITLVGCSLVVWFSKGLVALDTMDFWIGSMMLFVLAAILVVLFGWIMPIDKGFEEAAKGAAFPIPRIFRFVIKWICPAYLLIVFVAWLVQNAPGYVEHLSESSVALGTLGFIIAVAVLLAWMIRGARDRFDAADAEVEE